LARPNYSAVKLFIDPTIILVSTKVDDSVIDRFDPESKSGDLLSGDNDQFRLPFVLEVRPPSEFYYDAAKSKLVNLHLGEEDGTYISFNVPGELAANVHLSDDNVAGQQGQLLRLSGWIDIESRVTVSLSIDSVLSTNSHVDRSDARAHSYHIYNEGGLQHTFPAIMPHI
jgi:DNA mismatch repair protein MSH5